MSAAAHVMISQGQVWIYATVFQRVGSQDINAFCQFFKIKSVF